MTNPAAAARAKVLADWPGASVVARGRHSITLENPLNPNQKRVITQAGGAFHIRNSSTEIDTAWVVGDSTPYRRKMELADFHAYAGLNDLLEFDAGQIVKYVHPASGAEITFQPADLNWTNDIDQIEPVGSVQGVAGSLNDDTINWAGAYGPGLDFSWTAQTTRLQKLLTIQNAAAIGTPPQFIIDGGNPVLALNLQIQYSNDIRIFADGVEWNQKNNTEIYTASRVEFRAADGVTSLWFFEPGWVYDPNRPWPADWETNPDQSFTRHENVVTQVRNRANTFYVQVRVPWAFLEASTFPVHVDPSVSDDISASAHDVWWAGSDSTIDSYNMGDILIYIVSGNASQIRNGGFYFDIDTTIKGDTIDTASISSPGVYDSDMDSTIYCDDRDSPGVFYNGETTSSIDAARTTASAAWEDATWSSDEASADFASAVQEVTDRAGWTGGMRVYAYGGGTPSDSAACYAYDWSAGSAVTLDITYTAASSDLSVNETDGVTVGESITVAVSDSLVSLSDGVTIGDTVNLLVDGPTAITIDETDGVTVGDSVVLTLDDLTVDISDGVTVADSPALSLDDLAITETDGVTVADNAAVTLPDALEISESDGVLVGDSPSLALDDLLITESDGVTVADSANVTIPAIGQIDIDVTDGVTIGESQAVTLDDLTIAESDGVTVGDTVAVSLPDALTIDESDGVTVGDNIVASLDDLTISESDGVTVGDNVNVSVISAGEIAINVTDGVVVADSVTVEYDDLTVDQTDSITVGDSVTVSIPVIGELNVSVTDGVTVGDSITISLPDALAISTTDGITLGDNTTVAVSSIGAIEIDVTDNVTPGDSVTVTLPDALGITIADGVTIGEAVSVSGLYRLLDCGVSDTAAYVIMCSDVAAYAIVSADVAAYDVITADRSKQ